VSREPRAVDGDQYQSQTTGLWAVRLGRNGNGLWPAANNYAYARQQRVWRKHEVSRTSIRKRVHYSVTGRS